MEQANEKHKEEIQEFKKLHEAQTSIWKDEVENNSMVIVIALQQQIESLKYQVNEDEEGTQGLDIFKDHYLQILLILRKNQANFYKQLDIIWMVYKEIKDWRGRINSLVEEDISI